MGPFALLCPYELSNEAFITSTALHTGTPVRDPSGTLYFYHEGKTFHINSSSGVQQGYPLGSVLFALALHMLLTK